MISVQTATEKHIDCLVNMARKLCVGAKCDRYFNMDDGDARALVEFGINEDSHGCSLIALDDGTPVGCLIGARCINPLSSSSSLAREIVMWVEPESRGNGVARKLVEAFSVWARDRGIDHITIGYASGFGEDAVSALGTALGFVPLETYLIRKA